MTVVFMGRERLYVPVILSKQRTGKGDLFCAPGHDAMACFIAWNPYLTRRHPWTLGLLLCRAKIRLSISTEVDTFACPTEIMGSTVQSLNFLGKSLRACSQEVLARRAREFWERGYWRKALPSPLTTQGAMKILSLGQELSMLVQKKFRGRLWINLGKNPKKKTQDPGIIHAAISRLQEMSPSWTPRIHGIFATRTDTLVYCSSVPNLQSILDAWTKTGAPCSTTLRKRYVHLLGPISILVQVFKGKFSLGWIPSVGNPWHLIILMICFFLDSPDGPRIPLESWCKGSTLREIFSMGKQTPRNLNILGMLYPSTGTFPPKKFKEGFFQPWIHFHTLSRKSRHPIHLKKYPTLLVG